MELGHFLFQGLALLFDHSLPGMTWLEQEGRTARAVSVRTEYGPMFLSLPKREGVATAFILEHMCCTWALLEQALPSSLLPVNLQPTRDGLLCNLTLLIPHGENISLPLF
jgi:hypothetical protein